MADMDVLERRVATALLGYAGEIPDAVDAAAVARRVALRHPRRGASRVRWRGSAVARVAWVLLLAALLAAVAGMLVVGSQQERRWPVLVPPIGQRHECPPGSTPDEAGAADQARPSGEGALAFDDRAGKLVGLSNVAGKVQTWAFDVCTNTWAPMHPDREPAELGAPRLIFDADSDVTIAIEMGKATWAYDLEANTWLRKGVAPVAATERGLGWAYDPQSGLVVVALEDELWSYDVDSDRWAEISHAPWASWAVLAYDTSVGRIVAYTRYATWLVDVRTGEFSRSGAGSPGVYTLWGMNDYAPAIQYDAAAGQTVVSDLHGRAAAYNAVNDRWEILTGYGETLPFDAYDAVNKRLVGRGSDGSVLGFDLSTRQWTVLLQPDEGQPAPTTE